MSTHALLHLLRALLTLLAIAFGADALAAPAAVSLPPMPDVTVATVGTQTVSLPLQILALMTVITLLPGMLLAMTAFTRIIVVLAMLRQALGTGQTPSNQILLALALFVTALVMAPVIDASWAQGIRPYLDGQLEFEAALTATLGPIREFMFAQIREADLMLFAGMSGSTGYASPDEVPFTVLMASFLTSELKTAFQIGFFLFVPFVIIDLVIASVLMSMGMMMLSPMLISAPFKILLFVLVDGWSLVVGTLAASFVTT